MAWFSDAGLLHWTHSALPRGSRAISKTLQNSLCCISLSLPVPGACLDPSLRQTLELLVIIQLTSLSPLFSAFVPPLQNSLYHALLATKAFIFALPVMVRWLQQIAIVSFDFFPPCLFAHSVNQCSDILCNFYMSVSYIAYIVFAVKFPFLAKSATFFLHPLCGCEI
jgi:hypothetical protein